ncbi:hypothetical protein P7C73_g5752, partial [Tremellales sp. Uapishka_1]
MPRYLPLPLPTALAPHLRQLVPTPLANPLKSLPTVTDHLLSLPQSQLPPNLRVQEFVDHRASWHGKGDEERLGGSKRKEDRHLLKKGGLQWALRER